ncbi:hypothetical protein [Rossellomorea sp. y25]|nr:hypothetical protein [uncultured Rossellomorea sp.]
MILWNDKEFNEIEVKNLCRTASAVEGEKVIDYSTFVSNFKLT